MAGFQVRAPLLCVVAPEVFDLTFESHRSTHTVLGCLGALDSEDLSECDENGTTTTPLNFR
jgi:hypothetical protein